MTPELWDGRRIDLEVRAQVRAAEDAGLLDPKLLDGFEARIVSLLLEQVSKHLRPVRDVIGEAVAESTFGESDYRNRLDRQLATGAGAVADLAVEESLGLAVNYASLLVAEQHVTLRPAWPLDRKRSGRSSSKVSS